MFRRAIHLNPARDVLINWESPSIASNLRFALLCGLPFGWVWSTGNTSNSTEKSTSLQPVQLNISCRAFWTTWRMTQTNRNSCGWIKKKGHAIIWWRRTNHCLLCVDADDSKKTLIDGTSCNVYSECRPPPPRQFSRHALFSCCVIIIALNVLNINWMRNRKGRGWRKPSGTLPTAPKANMWCLPLELCFELVYAAYLSNSLEGHMLH